MILCLKGRNILTPICIWVWIFPTLHAVARLTYPGFSGCNKCPPAQYIAGRKINPVLSFLFFLVKKLLSAPAQKSSFTDYFKQKISHMLNSNMIFIPSSCLMQAYLTQQISSIQSIFKSKPPKSPRLPLSVKTLTFMEYFMLVDSSKQAC